jgi:hypothetical protein
MKLKTLVDNVRVLRSSFVGKLLAAEREDHPMRLAGTDPAFPDWWVFVSGCRGCGDIFLVQEDGKLGVEVEGGPVGSSWSSTFSFKPGDDVVPGPPIDDGGKVTERERVRCQRRLAAAQHAVQTGVLLELQRTRALAASGRPADVHRDDDGACSPKHLRVGVNMAMVEASVLAKLLIDKGLVTEREYFEALCEGTEEEQRKYEKIVGIGLA